MNESSISLERRVILKWVGWKLGYEGKPGWPAKDLTQKELDNRGLDKAKMLAYRPRLYEEVKPEVAEGKEVEHEIAEVKEVEPEIAEAKDQQDAPDEIVALYEEGIVEGAHDGEVRQEKQKKHRNSSKKGQ